MRHTTGCGIIAAGAKRQIAYLETCTQELKDLLDKVRAARASGQAFKGRIPARDSEYFQTNSLIKGPEETEWHASSSPEGRRTMTEWRSWRGPDGQPPVVCVPCEGWTLVSSPGAANRQRFQGHGPLVSASCPRKASGGRLGLCRVLPAGHQGLPGQRL